jgi:hypothetical protein
MLRDIKNKKTLKKLRVAKMKQINATYLSVKFEQRKIENSKIDFKIYLNSLILSNNLKRAIQKLTELNENYSNKELDSIVNLISKKESLLEEIQNYNESKKDVKIK